MKLVSYIIFALHSLRLAARVLSNQLRGDRISKACGLLQPHLVKFAHGRCKAGILETVCGRGGRFRPARDLRDIIIGDVTRITEGALDLMDRVNPAKAPDPRVGTCSLCRKLQEAIATFLDGPTVADVPAIHGQFVVRITQHQRPNKRKAAR